MANRTENAAFTEMLPETTVWDRLWMLGAIILLLPVWLTVAAAAKAWRYLADG